MSDFTAATGGKDDLPEGQSLLRRSVIAAPLLEQDRHEMGEAIHVVIELNHQFRGGVDDSWNRLQEVCKQLGAASLHRISEDYATGNLPLQTVEQLVSQDQSPDSGQGFAVHRVWPDFPIQPLINESVRTVKVDAARRSFACYGDRVVWAVIDSGISEIHPHFATYKNLLGEVYELHRDFTSGQSGPLVDEKGHGTHVAGIIAGGLPHNWKDQGEHSPHIFQESPDETGRGTRQLEQSIVDSSALSGMAPHAKLVSLKVIEPGAASEDRVSRLIEALAYVRRVNAGGRSVRIHGVNISLGYEFDPCWCACGHSPICKEVDKVVRSGVVVVVAAGNTGYGGLSAKERHTDAALQMTVNDPGNAERAFTVGSTHREQPYTYGVSYFSSKGPTGDGRFKPDVVAPGERIVSCAAGQLRPVDFPDTCAVYVEQTGTSMAAPHVSGAIAAFLSSRREFIGEPERVKAIFMGAATTLGRSRYFEGSGLLDLLRSMQSV
ncbi:S8 family peptidase [Streptomyces erythrochromogenes]|uniref:S8 family peptidase n=1 Tax=Streptomyces erythrochromogenes TaxID=285574 RepID=UPI00368769AF